MGYLKSCRIIIILQDESAHYPVKISFLHLFCVVVFILRGPSFNWNNTRQFKNYSIVKLLKKEMNNTLDPSEKNETMIIPIEEVIFTVLKMQYVATRLILP